MSSNFCTNKLKTAILLGYNLMLRLCATKKICATLRDSKKVCCDHCDSNWECCDFARPKKVMVQPLRLKWGILRLYNTEMFASLCPTQKKYFANLHGLKMYVATIATQNGHVATLCDRRNLSEFVRPKTDMLRLCDPKKICCDH